MVQPLPFWQALMTEFKRMRLPCSLLDHQISIFREFGNYCCHIMPINIFIITILITVLLLVVIAIMMLIVITLHIIPKIFRRTSY